MNAAAWLSTARVAETGDERRCSEWLPRRPWPFRTSVRRDDVIGRPVHEVRIHTVRVVCSVELRRPLGLLRRLKLGWSAGASGGEDGAAEHGQRTCVRRRPLAALRCGHAGAPPSQAVAQAVRARHGRDAATPSCERVQWSAGGSHVGGCTPVAASAAICSTVRRAAGRWKFATIF